jgi:dihydroxyacetone kinase
MPSIGYFLNIVLITHLCLHYNRGGEVGRAKGGGGSGGGEFIGFNGKGSLHQKTRPQFFTSAMLATIAITRGKNDQ